MATTRARATAVGSSQLAAGPVTPQSGPGRSILLCGHVMTGRGIDQILPHPGDSTLREPVADARRYVTYAETASGPSAAVGVVVAIDKLLCRKQYIHVVATGLMCIPPSAASRNLRPLDPSHSGAVSPRLSASQKLRLPAQNVHVAGEVPVGCARPVTAS